MASHVAFLRGMNLGGRRVKNEELRAEFEALFTACSQMMQLIPALPQPVIAEVQGIAQAQGAGADQFLENNDVKTFVGITDAFASGGRVLTAEQELDTYRRTGLVQRTSKFAGGV